MSVNIFLKDVKGIQEKNGYRFVQMKFRNKSSVSKKLTGQASVYFGEIHKWIVGRKLEQDDILHITVFSQRNSVSPKVNLGELKIGIESLTTYNELEIGEFLVDSKERMTSISITFLISYLKPDVGQTDGNVEDFNYPSFNMLSLAKSKMNVRKLPSEESSNDDDADWQLPEADEVESVAKFSDISEINIKDARIPDYLKANMIGSEPFTVSITITSCTQLAGSTVNPQVIVQVADKMYKSEQRLESNTPNFNQYFTFDFNLPRDQMMSKPIRIRVINNRKNLFLRQILRGRIVGEFTIDVRTVYMNKGHGFFNKWAVLIDPKSPFSGPKGYVLVTIGVSGLNDRLVPPENQASSEETNLEANLLMPKLLMTSETQRQIAEICVKVYQAEDWPSMNTEAMTHLKQVFVGLNKELANPQIQVSFAGHQGQTKPQKNTYTPAWNQEIAFAEMFPPFVKTIRVEMRDWNPIKNVLVASRVLDLHRMMNSSELYGFPPTFGPSWVNFYGTARQFTVKNAKSYQLNQDLGEGIAYRGRLLMGISTKFNIEASRFGSMIQPCAMLSNSAAGKKEMHFLFATIFDVNCVQDSIGKVDRPITFEMCIGNNGNIYDKFKTPEVKDDETEIAIAKAMKECGYEYESSAANKKKQSENWTLSTIGERYLYSFDKKYYHIPYRQRKPCMYMLCQYEDLRHRLLVPNILEKLNLELKQHIRQIRHIIFCGRLAQARRSTKSRLTSFAKSILRSKDSIKGCKCTAPKTQLDKYHQKMIRGDLERMHIKIGQMLRNLHRTTLTQRLHEMDLLSERLADMTVDPQDSLPDVFIYMVRDGERIAYARIRSRDVIFSNIALECGSMSGKISTIYFKRLGNEGMGRENWNFVCQMQIYLWLGLVREMLAYKRGLPAGYDRHCFGSMLPPKEIVYKECNQFKLRAYLQMARNLLSSEESGFSNCFARIIFGNRVLTTFTAPNTLSPVWDVTLISYEIEIPYTDESIKANPPNIVVEFFDEIDEQKKTNFFLGRCFCTPNVYLDDDLYEVAKLRWWDIYRGQRPAGQLLAAFDIFEVDTKRLRPKATNVPKVSQIRRDTCLINAGHDLQEQDQRSARVDDDEMEEDDESDVQSRHSDRPGTRASLASANQLTRTMTGKSMDKWLRIPRGIRHESSMYRLEVAIWGLRNVRKVGKLMKVKSPRVLIDMAGGFIESDVIENMEIKPNFECCLQSIDLKLPNLRKFWSPIGINVVNKGLFGRQMLIGNCVIINSYDFLEKLENDFTRSEDATTIIDEEGSENDMIKTQENEFKELEHFVMMNKQQNAEETMSAKHSGSGFDGKTAGLAVPGNPMAIRTPTKPSREQLGSADFWTRYYASIREIEKMELAKIDAENTQTDQAANKKHTQQANGDVNHQDTKQSLLTNAQKPANNGGDGVPETDANADGDETSEEEDQLSYHDEDVLKGIDVSIHSEEDEKNILEIPEETKKKKKRKRKKKKKRLYKPPYKPGSEKIFNEEDIELKLEDEVIVDDSWIERIKIYNCPLEDVKEFNGFSDPFFAFPLYRGQDNEDDSKEISRFAGTFKGQFLLYPIEPEDYDVEVEPEEMKLFKIIPDNNPINMIVRVYIIRAHNLHPKDKSGTSDPFLEIKLGHQKTNTRDTYIPKSCNPMFGNAFEFDVVFPQESLLQLSVYDYDRYLPDSLIGSTTIDLEARWLSKYKGLCGLGNQYTSHGYAKWKNQFLPSELLQQLCDANELEPPHYNKIQEIVTVAGQEFSESTILEDDDGTEIKSIEPLALKVLKSWKLMPEVGHPLVPEHIERRELYNPDLGRLEQGKVEMWVDMFPRMPNLVPPAMMDISPRQPMSYELRVIIHRTEHVLLNSKSLFSKNKSSDIMMKGFMKASDVDGQKTDVHHKSLSGQGLFNWRFVFKFDYLKAENVIVYKSKKLMDIDSMEKKVPCVLNLSVWDADLIMSDTNLGSTRLMLTSMPRPAKDFRSCGLHQTLASCPRFNLFTNKRARGWWPLIYKIQDLHPKLDSVGNAVGGLVDMELELITKDESDANPAGLGRDEPLPLQKPNRPSTSFSFMGPIGSIIYFIKYRLKWLLLKIFIILMLVLLIVLFIYNLPPQISRISVDKIFG